MDNSIPELEKIITQLKSLQKRTKAKMLVVDDEPDNLDLLYRTFRRDYKVLKAESGTRALELLREEGEVAVIISDQRMPEMKGTEFLSRTVPDFPNTVRIILTGFTDIEDLVDAINSGQVYKYITKPWDPNELKNADPNNRGGGCAVRKQKDPNTEKPSVSCLCNHIVEFTAENTTNTTI